MNDFVDRIRLEQHKVHEDALVSAIRSGHLALGPHIEQLERDLEDRFGKKHAILTTNGFSALCATLLAIRNECSTVDVATVAAGTCFAMVNAIKSAGFRPNFVDLDLQTAGIHECAFVGRELIIAPNHFGRISTALRKKSVNKGLIIEDSAQSFFSRERVSTCADVVVHSFYPTKWVNGIDGGAILLDDDDLASSIRRQVSYVSQVSYETQPRHNFAMSNLHAAMVLASLELATDLASSLNFTYSRLSNRLKGLGFNVLARQPDEIPTRFIVCAPSSEIRDMQIKNLHQAGIGASKELYFVCPVAEQSNFPQARRLIDCSYSLPFHPWLSSEEIERIEIAMAGL